MIKGDQILARECYQAILALKDNHTWMMEERTSEAMEALEPIILVEGEPVKVTNIGANLDPTMKGGIEEFLKNNLDVFAWSHENMPDISKDLIRHQLNVDHEKKLIKKKVFRTQTK